jgi:hypothetical protein
VAARPAGDSFEKNTGGDVATAHAAGARADEARADGRSTQQRGREGWFAQAIAGGAGVACGAVGESGFTLGGVRSDHPAAQMATRDAFWGDGEDEAMASEAY